MSEKPTLCRVLYEEDGTATAFWEDERDNAHFEYKRMQWINITMCCSGKNLICSKMYGHTFIGRFFTYTKVRNVILSFRFRLPVCVFPNVSELTPEWLLHCFLCRVIRHHSSHLQFRINPNELRPSRIGEFNDGELTTLIRCINNERIF